MRSTLPSYRDIYPTPRSPTAQILRPLVDTHAVLHRDVEASGSDGLRRLVAARAHPMTHDLVLIATNEGSIDVAVNCVANLAAVGIDHYVLLASKPEVCMRVVGRIACVWSTLLEQYRERLKEAHAGGMQMLWLVRQIYAGRIAHLGFNPFVLDSDSVLFENPFEAIATHLPGYQLYVMADNSGTWSSLNCGTYYLKGADPRGTLLSAWTNFERRAFAVLNTSHPFPVTTTNGRPEPLLVWENTLLDWTFAGAMVGDPNFVGRGRTTDARILSKDESRQMRWQACAVGRTHTGSTRGCPSHRLATAESTCCAARLLSRSLPRRRRPPSAYPEVPTTARAATSCARCDSAARWRSRCRRGSSPQRATHGSSMAARSIGPRGRLPRCPAATSEHPRPRPAPSATSEHPRPRPAPFAVAASPLHALLRSPAMIDPRAARRCSSTMCAAASAPGGGRLRCGCSGAGSGRMSTGRSGGSAETAAPDVSRRRSSSSSCCRSQARDASSGLPRRCL